MSTNGVNNIEEADMMESDGEKVVTMMDVLQEQQDFEEDANAVLGASDDKECTYSKGYIKRQAIYACLTCCSEAKDDPNQRAGVCLACSLKCHENHELIELYTKRNFRCDCGNPKFKTQPCQFNPNKSNLNEDNNYNQNFSGLYCICHRPYPDPETTVEDEMIQCIICEDWLHSTHLEATLPANDQYAEMICKACMEKNEFLHDYSQIAVNYEVEVDITSENETDNSLMNVTTNNSLLPGVNMENENVLHEKDNSQSSNVICSQDNLTNNEKKNDVENAKNIPQEIDNSITTDNESPKNNSGVELNENTLLDCPDPKKSTEMETSKCGSDSKSSNKINVDNEDEVETKKNNENVLTPTDQVNINEIRDDSSIDKEQTAPAAENNQPVTKQIEEMSKDTTKDSTTEECQNQINICETDSLEAATKELSELVSGNGDSTEKTNEKENDTIAVKVQSDTVSKTLNGDSIGSENAEKDKKRKLVDDTDEVFVKKQKFDTTENCLRPKGIKKSLKGATFWPSNFRQKLCTCNSCLCMYKDLNVIFLTDMEDTVMAYETLGKQINDGGPATQYEKGLQALSSLDRVQQINALTEYNKMRDKLLDFLKSFKDRKEIVKEEDIKAFFAGMKPRREPDGVYFCR